MDHHPSDTKREITPNFGALVRENAQQPTGAHEITSKKITLKLTQLLNPQREEYTLNTSS